VLCVLGGVGGGGVGSTGPYPMSALQEGLMMSTVATTPWHGILLVAAVRLGRHLSREDVALDSPPGALKHPVACCVLMTGDSAIHGCSDCSAGGALCTFCGDSCSWRSWPADLADGGCCLPACLPACCIERGSSRCWPDAWHAPPLASLQKMSGCHTKSCPCITDALLSNPSR